MPAVCAAAPDRVSILLGSNHIGAKIRLEQVNPGVFLTGKGERIDWTAGSCRNSFGKMFASVSASLRLIGWQNGGLAAFAGGVLYPGDGRTFAVPVGDLVPIGGLQLRHGHAFVQIIPSDGRTVDAIVTFAMTFSFEPQR